MFGFTIVRTERLKEIEAIAYRAHSINYYIDWFSGWPNIYELLLKFKKGEISTGNIWNVRSEFAKTMNTDDWGKPLGPKPKGGSSE